MRHLMSYNKVTNYLDADVLISKQAKTKTRSPHRKLDVGRGGRYTAAPLYRGGIIFLD